MNSLKVENLEGKEELFSRQKVYRSARNAGASQKLARKIAREIEKKAYPGIKTSEIFEEIKSFLRKENFKVSLKFDLKAAMRRLGPTGFPFEKYIKSIFESKGFKTKINVHIKGKCCTHEIDFLARQSEKVYLGECKYRNFSDGSVSTNIALSSYARFLDLREGGYLQKFAGSKVENMLVTNAKFTSKAVCYSTCVGLRLLGWKYPRKKGLEKIIEENNLYPITILPSLTPKLAQAFILEEKMLANDILKIDPASFLKKVNISLPHFEKLKKEAEILLAKED